MAYLLSTEFLFEDHRSETLQSLSEKINPKLVDAKYFSSDNKSGYAKFLLLPGDSFIYEKIPIKIWLEYKQCPSPDLYYETNILNKYKCIPKQLRSEGSGGFQ